MGANMVKRLLLASLLALSASTCADQRSHTQAVYMLIDTSGAYAQERAFRDKIDAFVKSVGGSAYTDITGGLIQGGMYLNETGAGKKTILIFSDMQEELDKVTVRDFPINLKDIRVVALNVVKLKTDNIDPRRYMGRLEAWQKRIEKAGASEWILINDIEHLDSMLRS